MPLRLATRGSRQALAQSSAVATSIEQATGVDVELVLIETSGDKRLDVALHEIGGLGVFVKEVQHAVLSGTADIAVHSAKDLPSTAADGLVIAAFAERRSPADALVGAALADLAVGATVATGSVRRQAQLRRARPDLHFVELRGSIDTRLSKIPPDGAIVMAVAALEILEMTERIAQQLPVEQFVPAVGQGCVAVECRSGDDDTIQMLSSIDHPLSRHAVEVERAFLAELGSGCSLPVGGHVDHGVLRAFLAAGDESVIEEVELSGDSCDVVVAAATARAVMDRLR